MPNLAERSKQIIAKIPYITIASVSANGRPWNSPVFAAYDEDYNFFFGTHRESQKARNIQANEDVFLVIYDSTVPAGDGEGVYIRASAVALDSPEDIRFAHKLLWDRHTVPYWKLEEFGPNSPLVLYKVTPQEVWTNDEGEADGHYVDTRTAIKLR